jgi:hypothetical protein
VIITVSKQITADIARMLTLKRFKQALLSTLKSAFHYNVCSYSQTGDLTEADTANGKLLANCDFGSKGYEIVLAPIGAVRPRWISLPS